MTSNADKQESFHTTRWVFPPLCRPEQQKLQAACIHYSHQSFNTDKLVNKWRCAVQLDYNDPKVTPRCQIFNKHFIPLLTESPVCFNPTECLAARQKPKSLDYLSVCLQLVKAGRVESCHQHVFSYITCFNLKFHQHVLRKPPKLFFCLILDHSLGFKYFCLTALQWSLNKWKELATRQKSRHRLQFLSICFVLFLPSPVRWQRPQVNKKFATLTTLPNPIESLKRNTRLTANRLTHLGGPHLDTLMPLKTR